MLRLSTRHGWSRLDKYPENRTLSGLRLHSARIRFSASSSLGGVAWWAAMGKKEKKEKKDKHKKGSKCALRCSSEGASRTRSTAIFMSQLRRRS